MRTSRVAVALLILIAVLSACESGVTGAGTGEQLPLTMSWTQYGNTPDHSDLRVQGPGPPLEHYWTFTGGHFIPTGFRPPVISDGRIFVSDDSLFSLDGTGKKLWSHSPADTFLLSNPAILEDLVLFAHIRESQPGVVVEALEQTSGEPVWSWSTRSRGFDAVGVITSGDKVLVIGERRGIRRSSVAGTDLWLIDDGGKLLWSSATTSPAVVRSADGFEPLGAVSRGVVVVTVQNGVEAYRITDGERLWSAGADRFFPQRRLFAPVTYWDLAPVTIANNRVLTLAENESGISWFRVFNVRTGRKLFERKGSTIGSGASTFTSTGDEILLETGFGPRPHHLIVLDAGDFSVRRRVPLDRRMELLEGGKMLVLGGGLMAAAGNSLVHIDRSGLITWKFHIDFRKPLPLESQAPGSTGLVPTGGGYLVSTSDGLLHAFGPPSK